MQNEASNFRYVPLFNWISKFAQAIMKKNLMQNGAALEIKGEKKENSRENHWVFQEHIY